MPKTAKVQPVTQPWTWELPFMQQALLMTAMRGPDGVSKEIPAKWIVRYLRGVVLQPADNIEGNEDSFMWINYTGTYGTTNHFSYCVDTFFYDTDYLPMHFLMHLIHAAEVVAYKHEDLAMREHWLFFYKKACKALHMQPETENAMDARMDM